MSGLGLLLPAITSAVATAGSAVAAAAPTLTTIGTVAGVAGTGLSILGGIQQAEAGKAAADVEAKNLKMQATEERAAAQRDAEIERRRTKMVLSTQLAKGAADGGGTGGSIADIMAGTEAEGQLHEQRAYYLGDSRAAGLNQAAAATKFKAKANYAGTLLDTAGQAGKDIYNMRKGYG